MIDPGPAIVHGSPALPIELPIMEGPPTGYVWSLDLPPGVIRIEDGPAVPPPAGAHFGASTGRHLRVTAPKGRYRITARLARPWQPGAPAQTVVIELIVE
jgi:predicted secreted protein